MLELVPILNAGPHIGTRKEGEKEMKTSFILYLDQYEPIKDLPLEKKGELLDAIFMYQINPNNPVGFSGNEVLIAFNFIKISLDRDLKKWNNIVKRSQENGKKGGRPRLGRKTQDNLNNPGGFLDNLKTLVSVSVSDSVNNRESTRSLEKSLTYLESIPLEDVKEFQKTSSATDEQIRSKALELIGYCRYKGKKYKNYKAFLSNSLKKDYPIKKEIAVGEKDEDGYIRRA